MQARRIIQLLDAGGAGYGIQATYKKCNELIQLSDIIAMDATPWLQFCKVRLCNNMWMAMSLV